MHILSRNHAEYTRFAYKNLHKKQKPCLQVLTNDFFKTDKNDINERRRSIHPSEDAERMGREIQSTDRSGRTENETTEREDRSLYDSEALIKAKQILDAQEAEK